MFLFERGQWDCPRQTLRPRQTASWGLFALKYCCFCKFKFQVLKYFLKNQNFHSRYVRNFIYVHIPNVKTVVIVYITENKNKIDF